jgi:hypothetical protein|tara:strand:- start:20608 stop:21075 length:468 start_codon:yes stop_codon:yes gene_type:complete
MSATGYGLDTYQDIASASLGGFAGSVAPTYQQAALNTQKGLMQNEYQRDLMRRNKARNDIDMGLSEERAYRALPGQFNRRGMIDSGQYQRGGRELASNIMRARNRADEDFMQNMMTSNLQDAMSISDLEGLRGNLTSNQYQALVASMVRGAGGAA